MIYSSSSGSLSSTLMLSKYFVVTLGTLDDLLYSVVLPWFVSDYLISFGACVGEWYLCLRLLSLSFFLLFGSGSLLASKLLLGSIELLSTTGGWYDGFWGGFDWVAFLLFLGLFDVVRFFGFLNFRLIVGIHYYL